MADARDRITRTLADYLPHSPASENIEDRRGDDPRAVALDIWKQRHPFDRAVQMHRDMNEAERISARFRRQ